jgi:hypothetical protein
VRLFVLPLIGPVFVDQPIQTGTLICRTCGLRPTFGVVPALSEKNHVLAVTHRNDSGKYHDMGCELLQARNSVHATRVGFSQPCDHEWSPAFVDLQSVCTFVQPTSLHPRVTGLNCSISSGVVDVWGSSTWRQHVLQHDRCAQTTFLLLGHA